MMARCAVDPETLTECALPFFQLTRKNMSSFSLRSPNVVKRTRKSPTISRWREDTSRGRILVAMEMIA
jgi:hypothetical protein